jgi:hypothetical protein
MDRGKEIARLLLRSFGVRVGPQTGSFAARRLDSVIDGNDEPITVLGGDARTGVPVSRNIPRDDLHRALST